VAPVQAFSLLHALEQNLINHFASIV